jgi:hypothetical protein
MVRVQQKARGSEIFFRAGLDDPNQLEMLGEFSVCAQRSCEAFEPLGTAPSDRFARRAGANTPRYAFGRAFARPKNADNAPTKIKRLSLN